MNVTPSKTGMQNEPNGTTISEQSSHKFDLIGLPVDLIENIGSRLSYPDVCNLRLVCKRTFSAISNRIVKKASTRNFYYEFPNMKKYRMNQEEIDLMNKAEESDFCSSFHFHYQFFSINNEDCVVEQIGKPKYKNFFSRFEIEDYDPFSKELHRSGIHFDTGVLENGLFFLQTPNPLMIRHHIKYYPQINKIAWFGNTSFSIVKGEPNFYSFYVGESFEVITKIFKIKNINKPLASQIEDMLKNRKKIYI